MQIPPLSRVDDEGAPRRDMDESGRGPRRSCSRNRSISFGDPTKYKQAHMIPPPDRPVARVNAAVKLHPPFGSTAVSRPKDENDAVGPE